VVGVTYFDSVDQARASIHPGDIVVEMRHPEDGGEV
jgi:hypothetical protein